MRITVIGGTGLVGSKLVAKLKAAGHEVVAASRKAGVNAATGDGLAAALDGADVVVDVSQSPSLEDGPAMDFFQAVTRNVLAAAKAAGVSHVVALSIVGTEGLQASGYFRAKLAQERAIIGGGLPYTVVRATQFFEFVQGIRQWSMAGGVARLPDASVQPVAADDVAAEMARVATGTPANAVVDFAGPERMSIADWVRSSLRAGGDATEVVVDPAATYFGLAIDDKLLVPGGPAETGPTRLADWLGAGGR
jgi:uncharacterized protein YbjT (DUF2867 family)